jgi:tetratricopeptide (TPR) repeat protein
VSRWLAALCLPLVTACTAMPADPFERGKVALQKGDLLTALRAFEAVPGGHARRDEARVNVAEVEDRVRRSHQALLEGIVLRTQGRDRQALASMQRARETWPALPSIDIWIAATRERANRTSVRIVSASPRPAVDCERESGAESASIDAIAVAGAEPARVAGSDPEDRDERAAAPIDRGEDPIALGLIAVEARLGHGELELAVIDLLELARRFPHDTRVQQRLVRVLHQRALLRYGQGALTTAISDWERVLALQPDNRLVRALLDAVRAEAASPL